MLRLAAREADIVGLVPGFSARGWPLIGEATEAATSRKVAMVREAAGARFESIELNVWLADAGLVGSGNSVLGSVLAAVKRAPMAVYGSPYLLYGTLASARTTVLSSATPGVSTTRSRRGHGIDGARSKAAGGGRCPRLRRASGELRRAAGRLPYRYRRPRDGGADGGRGRTCYLTGYAGEPMGAVADRGATLSRSGAAPEARYDDTPLVAGGHAAVGVRGDGDRRKAAQLGGQSNGRRQASDRLWAMHVLALEAPPDCRRRAPWQVREPRQLKDADDALAWLPPGR
jgi:hypothetical protein